MAESAGSAVTDSEHRHASARLGWPRLHLRRTDSTNERARQLAIAGAPHGTLVIADEQTAGRGRHGRSWVAAPGTCLLCSLVLRWPESSHPPALLPLMAGVAVGEAIGQDAHLKWPNDVVLGDDLKKLAGILVEARTQDGWAVLGIGVNVALDLRDLPADVRGRAATLGREPAAIEPLLADLLAALSAGLTKQPQQTLAAWRARDALAGRQIAWGQDQRGQAQGVDEEGRLLVLSAEGSTVTLSAGDVHLSTVD
ncbi:MAG TPA: biotin--[acetyl-CoA-carboxylase] ligase [Solirubrobacteraceae bacterium]|nr:biotin--[acetyl-CoA-carboxylase] ligase [Solirubrobacteraceae bacterium]